MLRGGGASSYYRKQIEDAKKLILGLLVDMIANTSPNTLQAFPSAVSLPPDQVSKGVKKSKSLPLNTLGRGQGSLPPPVTSKSQRPGIPQSPSLCSFLPMLNGDPLRSVQVLPAIPSQRKYSPTVGQPKMDTLSKLDNRT